MVAQLARHSERADAERAHVAEGHRRAGSRGMTALPHSALTTRQLHGRLCRPLVESALRMIEQPGVTLTAM